MKISFKTIDRVLRIFGLMLIMVQGTGLPSKDYMRILPIWKFKKEFERCARNSAGVVTSKPSTTSTS